MHSEPTIEEYRELVARLTVRIIKLAQLNHRRHNGTRQWFECNDDECRRTWLLLREGKGTGD